MQHLTQEKKVTWFSFCFNNCSRRREEMAAPRYLYHSARLETTGLITMHRFRVFQEFADAVFHLVTEKFKELTDNLTSSHARHKVLAGIVMTRGKETQNPEGNFSLTHKRCLEDVFSFSLLQTKILNVPVLPCCLRRDNFWKMYYTSSVEFQHATKKCRRLQHQRPVKCIAKHNAECTKIWLYFILLWESKHLNP